MITRYVDKRDFASKKKELDERAANARHVKAEWEKSMTGMLSEKDIRTVDTEVTRLANALEKLGELDFSQRRQLVEAMGITGEIRKEDTGAFTLHLFVFGYDVASVYLLGEQSDQSSLA